MAHLHHPLVGDSVYAGRLKIPAGASASLIDTLKQFGRQALHAKRLCLIHPETEDERCWEVDLPEDMQALIAVLRADQESRD